MSWSRPLSPSPRPGWWSPKPGLLRQRPTALPEATWTSGCAAPAGASRLPTGGSAASSASPARRYRATRGATWSGRSRSSSARTMPMTSGQKASALGLVEEEVARTLAALVRAVGSVGAEVRGDAAITDLHALVAARIGQASAAAETRRTAEAQVAAEAGRVAVTEAKAAGAAVAADERRAEMAAAMPGLGLGADAFPRQANAPACPSRMTTTMCHSRAPVFVRPAASPGRAAGSVSRSASTIQSLIGGGAARSCLPNSPSRKSVDGPPFVAGERSRRSRRRFSQTRAADRRFVALLSTTPAAFGIGVPGRPRNPMGDRSGGSRPCRSPQSRA
jgi:hypothetical protein